MKEQLCNQKVHGKHKYNYQVPFWNELYTQGRLNDEKHLSYQHFLISANA